LNVEEAISIMDTIVQVPCKRPTVSDQYPWKAQPLSRIL
jgi:hypothetical protein